MAVSRFWIQSENLDNLDTSLVVTAASCYLSEAKMRVCAASTEGAVGRMRVTEEVRATCGGGKCSQGKLPGAKSKPGTRHIPS